MIRPGFALLALVPALALGGCATTGTPRLEPVDVTRYHLDSAIAPGTVAVTWDDSAIVVPADAPAARAAVRTELTSLGFGEADAASADYIATLSLQRRTQHAARERPPVAVGIGGATGSYGSGIGAGISFDIGGGRRNVVGTMLTLRITERATGRTLWEGSARTATTMREGDTPSDAVAAHLAQALFKDFPGLSGITITVP